MELDASGTQLLNFPVDGGGDDPKHLAELSTLLVATIQEAKDRIAQVEFIFCSRLFPAFQSRTKTLQARISEAHEAAAEEWRQREAELLLEIKGLMVEKQHTVKDWRQEKAEILARHAAEKEVLRAKLEGLEKSEVVVDELREQLRLRTAELAERNDMQERLLRLVNEKQEEMAAERGKKRRLQEGWKELSDRYKQIKSQYKFLLKKSGLVGGDGETEGEVDFASPVTPISSNNSAGTEDKSEDINSLVSEINKLHDNSASLQKANSHYPSSSRHNNFAGTEDKCEDANFLISEINKLHDMPASSEKEKSHHPSSSRPSSNSDERSSRCIIPSSSGIHANKYPAIKKPVAAVGSKQPVSSWRDTRANQVQRGIDPHDDFLDTPLENVRETLKNPPPQVKDIPELPPNDMDFNNSDEETQDPSTRVPKPPISAVKTGDTGFKYVEPVRKKAARENLQGYECKQCKKFYDAVHSTGNRNETSSNNIRCEHHEGVSRHRYRYAPPSTPEGFWNIGFDSEM